MAQVYLGQPQDAPIPNARARGSISRPAQPRPPFSASRRGTLLLGFGEARVGDALQATARYTWPFVARDIRLVGTAR